MVFIHLFIQKLLSSTSGSEVGYYVRSSPTSLCLPLEQHCATELSVTISNVLCTVGERDTRSTGGGPCFWDLRTFLGQAVNVTIKMTRKFIGIALGIRDIPLNSGKVIIKIIKYLSLYLSLWQSDGIMYLSHWTNMGVPPVCRGWSRFSRAWRILPESLPSQVEVPCWGYC